MTIETIVTNFIHFCQIAHWWGGHFTLAAKTPRSPLQVVKGHKRSMCVNSV